MILSLLYRGPLTSCNYECSYCPFAKRRESRAELRRDRDCLERFLQWVQANSDLRLRILFTPWGEALVRPWYREALVRLASMQHVTSAGAQTNLSCEMEWVTRCDPGKLFLWCTWHPSEATLASFVRKCRQLDLHDIRHSAGIVGVPQELDSIRALRAALPAETYVWINALDGKRGRYSKALIREFTRIDPYFGFTVTGQSSAGRWCHAGESSFSVDGEGEIRRCHFVDQPIGNLYRDGLRAAAAPRRCPRVVCRCHIGYVNLPGLPPQAAFADGGLARIPAEWATPGGSVARA